MIDTSYTIPKLKIRGFKVVPGWAKKNKDLVEKDYILPKRSTKYSAGYDFYFNSDFTLLPKETKIYWTDICSYMKTDEVLKIYIRSSIAIKRKVILANQVAIVDADYYSNKSNFGNIGICLTNNSDDIVSFKEGEKVAQGIFEKYFISEDDNVTENRTGGVGSTN